MLSQPHLALALRAQERLRCVFAGAVCGGRSVSVEGKRHVVL